MIENYKHTIDDEGYDKSKRSIGKVYRYENDTFISMGKHFFDFKINHAALSSLIILFTLERNIDIVFVIVVMDCDIIIL